MQHAQASEIEETVGWSDIFNVHISSTPDGYIAVLKTSNVNLLRENTSVEIVDPDNLLTMYITTHMKDNVIEYLKVSFGGPHNFHQSHWVYFFLLKTTMHNLPFNDQLIVLAPKARVLGMYGFYEYTEDSTLTISRVGRIKQDHGAILRVTKDF